MRNFFTQFHSLPGFHGETYPVTFEGYSKSNPPSDYYSAWGIQNPAAALVAVRPFFDANRVEGDRILADGECRKEDTTKWRSGFDAYAVYESNLREALKLMPGVRHGSESFHRLMLEADDYRAGTPLSWMYRTGASWGFWKSIGTYIPSVAGNPPGVVSRIFHPAHTGGWHPDFIPTSKDGGPHAAAEALAYALCNASWPAHGKQLCGYQQGGPASCLQAILRSWVDSGTSFGKRIEPLLVAAYGWGDTDFPGYPGAPGAVRMAVSPYCQDRSDGFVSFTPQDSFEQWVLESAGMDSGHRRKCELSKLVNGWGARPAIVNAVRTAVAEALKPPPAFGKQVSLRMDLSPVAKAKGKKAPDGVPVFFPQGPANGEAEEFIQSVIKAYAPADRRSELLRAEYDADGWRTKLQHPFHDPAQWVKDSCMRGKAPGKLGEFYAQLPCASCLLLDTNGRLVARWWVWYPSDGGTYFGRVYLTTPEAMPYVEELARKHGWAWIAEARDTFISGPDISGWNCGGFDSHDTVDGRGSTSRRFVPYMDEWKQHLDGTYYISDSDEDGEYDLLDCTDGSASFGSGGGRFCEDCQETRRDYQEVYRLARYSRNDRDGVFVSEDCDNVHEASEVHGFPFSRGRVWDASGDRIVELRNGSYAMVDSTISVVNRHGDHQYYIADDDTDDVVRLTHGELDGEWVECDEAVRLDPASNYEGDYVLAEEAVQLTAGEHEGDYVLRDEARELYDGEYVTEDEAEEIEAGEHAGEYALDEDLVTDVCGRRVPEDDCYILDVEVRLINEHTFLTVSDGDYMEAGQYEALMPLLSILSGSNEPVVSLTDDTVAAILAA